MLHYTVYKGKKKKGFFVILHAENLVITSKQILIMTCQSEPSRTFEIITLKCHS